MSDAPAVIAYVGALVGLAGGGVALFNARKAVQWKRAELANSYLKDLTANQELVFACRALDWNGGLLVVPDSLRPLILSKSEVIEHDPIVLRQSLQDNLLLSEMNLDPRIQVYRTAVDALLSWMNLISSAIERKLFTADDVREVGYWVFHIEHSEYLEDFIRAFGYLRSTQKLRLAFRHIADTYAYQPLPA